MKRIMTITDETNETKQYEIFCSFDSDMTGKSYVIYTEYCEDDEKQLIMLAGVYEQIDEDNLKVNKNLTHEENEMISEVVKNIIEQAEKLDKEKSAGGNSVN